MTSTVFFSLVMLSTFASYPLENLCNGGFFVYQLPGFALLGRELICHVFFYDKIVLGLDPSFGYELTGRCTSFVFVGVPLGVVYCAEATPVAADQW